MEWRYSIAVIGWLLICSGVSVTTKPTMVPSILVYVGGCLILGALMANRNEGK